MRKESTYHVLCVLYASLLGTASRNMGPASGLVGPASKYNTWSGIWTCGAQHLEVQVQHLDQKSLAHTKKETQKKKQILTHVRDGRPPAWGDPRNILHEKREYLSCTICVLRYSLHESLASWRVRALIGD